MKFNTYTILSSTSTGTQPFGTYHAPTADEALAAAKQDLARLCSYSQIFNGAFGQAPVRTEVPELWIEGV